LEATGCKSRKGKARAMKITFRLECSRCGWGHEWSDNYVNMGWLVMRCSHCEEKFYTKIDVTGVSINSQTELPEGQPCTTLQEAKE
jgi:ribosomal protein L33